MYSTRRLSVYKNSPEAISESPEGPNSGYLVIQDEDSTPRCCFGLCKDPSIKDLPFPQNKRLAIKHTTSHGQGSSTSGHKTSSTSGHKTSSTSGHKTSSTTTTDMVYLIPVINQPLSSHRYYAVKADGRRKGEAYASSKEEDKVICCFCIPCIKDVKPRPPFDPNDIYQQFEFSVTQTCFNTNKLLAKSVAPDGYPPYFLRRKGWYMESKSIKNFTMGEARGIDSSLRANLPDFSFPSSQECSKSVVVGKWYCPFMFIKDGREKEQIKNLVFYEMTLEQRWERISAAERSFSHGKTVSVDVVVPTETVRVEGQHAAQQEGTHDSRGMVYFTGADGLGNEKRVGLSSLIVERMMWEENRVGWVNEKEKQARVVRDEVYGGVAEWRSFGCYLLVETFVLKRNDGSVVLSYDFRHIHQIRSKWD